MRRPTLVGKLILAAAALLAVGAAQASQDLITTWRTALSNDPVYAAARAQYRALQEAEPQARAAVLPWLSATGEVTHHDDRGASSLRHDGSHHRTAWELTLTQPLYDRAAWSALEQSKLVVADAEIALAMAYQDVMLRSAQAYFDVLAAQDTLTAIQAEKASIAAQMESAKRNFELGNATITDTYEAQARHDLILADELQAQLALDVALDALSKLLGTEPDTLAALPQGVQLPAPQPNHLQEWLDQAQTAALIVQRTQLEQRIAEAGIDIARSGHYPTLDLLAKTGSASDMDRIRDRSGRGLESSIGLQLNIPIYSGGLTSSRVRENVELAQRALYDTEDARRSAVQNTRRYFTGVNSGLARIRALEAGERSSRAAVEANRKGYEIGVRINLDVLNAQQQLYTTLRDLARARYDTLMAGLRLRAITGILSENDLQTINQLLLPPSTDSHRPQRQGAGLTPPVRTSESFVPRQSSSARTRMESPLRDRPNS